jgi:hypothetical protein
MTDMYCPGCVPPWEMRDVRLDALELAAHFIVALYGAIVRLVQVGQMTPTFAVPHATKPSRPW